MQHIMYRVPRKYNVRNTIYIVSCTLYFEIVQPPIYISLCTTNGSSTSGNSEYNTSKYMQLTLIKSMVSM